MPRPRGAGALRLDGKMSSAWPPPAFVTRSPSPHRDVGRGRRTPPQMLHRAAQVRRPPRYFARSAQQIILRHRRFACFAAISNHSTAHQRTTRLQPITPNPQPDPVRLALKMSVR